MANEKKYSEISIATILSNRTKEGMIDFTLNDEKTQWDIAKAKEIRDMLTEAIEAAISDTLIYKFLTQKIGVPENQATIMLLEFRELRQGTKGIAWPN
jgi:hypothetical protein